MSRRITPQLISPSQASFVQPEFVAAAEQPVELRLNLKEQAQIAKDLLGPGRKLYVDISAEPKVNWRKLQKSLGVSLSKPQQKAPQLNLPTGDKTQALPFAAGPPVGGGGSNALTRVIERLENSYGHNKLDSEDSDSDSPSEAPDRPEDAGSDDQDSDAAPNEGDYELQDDFIDDSEVYEFYEGDWRKPKHTGFYINTGDIEKTDELMFANDEDSPKAKKRRPKKPDASSPDKPDATSPDKPAKTKGLKQVIGKDGRPKLVKKKRNPDSVKANGSANLVPGAKTPGKVPKQKGSNGAGLARQALSGQAGANPAMSFAAPGTAQGAAAGAHGQLVGAHPEQDRVPLAAMAAAGLTPLRPQAMAHCLPKSPPAAAPMAAGEGQGLPEPLAAAKTPLTGKKRSREGFEGGAGYIIPPHIKTVLDELNALAEELGVNEAAAPDEAAAGAAPDEKQQKKLPTQLNPLLARLARDAATENDKTPGARTTIANAAYAFLHPWTQKGNMAVRLKKLHESAQQRYEKYKEWLVKAVAGQAAESEQRLALSSEGLPTAAPQPSSSSSKMIWTEPQIHPLVELLSSILELRGGTDESPQLWEDLAAQSDLWAPFDVSAQELQTVYMQNKKRYAPEAEGQPRKRPRKARPQSGGATDVKSEDVLTQRPSGHDLNESQTPSASLSPIAPPPVIAPRVASSDAPAVATAAAPLVQQPATAGLVLPAAQPSVTVVAGTTAAAEDGSTRPYSSGTVPVPDPSLPRQASGAASQGGQPLSSLGGDAGGVKPASKEEFLQMGVQHGGDYTLLARGLQLCKEGTTKDTIYKVLLHAGQAGLKVAKIVERAVSLGLVAPDWVQNKNSRSSQVSNGIRNTDLFVHIGEHHYAIAALPGVKEVPLKEKAGKRSSDKQSDSVKSEPAQGQAAAVEHVASTGLPPMQPLTALPSGQQDAAAATVSCQPLRTEASISSFPMLHASGGHVMLPAAAGMQPVEMQPPILAAAMNSLLQSGQPSMQQLLHGDESGAQPLPQPYPSLH